MKKYRCVVCEWIYDPAVGDPDGGIAPGTPFEEIPDDGTTPPHKPTTPPYHDPIITDVEFEEIK